MISEINNTPFKYIDVIKQTMGIDFLFDEELTWVYYSLPAPQLRYHPTYETTTLLYSKNYQSGTFKLLTKHHIQHPSLTQTLLKFLSQLLII